MPRKTEVLRPAPEQPSTLEMVSRTALQSAESARVRYQDAVTTANRVEIKSEADRKSWSAFHADLTAAIKLVDEERKDAAAPWDRVTKSINAAYRQTLDALESAKRLVGTRLAIWIAEERKRQEEELAAQRERERLAAKAAVESGQQIIVKPKTPEPPVENAVRTQAGTTSTRETWDCEVTNPSEIPREFLVFDKQLALAKCRAMEKSVGAPREDAFPGLRVFKSLSVASTRRP